MHLINLRKTYPGGTVALKDINLVIKPGILGLLGPNGAGKSTLMRMMATLQLPDTGDIQYAGYSTLRHPRTFRNVLGYLPQDFGVYPQVSAERLLHYLAVLKGISSRQHRRIRIDEVLERVNLSDYRKQAVHTYSGGMLRRFGIAQLLLNDPSFIIVDEPTAGLDPGERQHFLQLLQSLSEAKTIVFSTHIVDDMQELCTDIAILDQGCLLLHQTPQQAQAELQGKIWTWTQFPNAPAEVHHPDTVLSISGGSHGQRHLRIYAEKPPIAEALPSPPNLADVYFYQLYQNGVTV